MAKRRITARSVFALFKRLNADEQAEFVRLASDDFHNPVAWERQRAAILSMNEMIADDERIKTEIKLRRMKRKPNYKYRADVMRLRDEEKLTFGQIAKRLGKTRDAVEKLYGRAKGPAHKRSAKPS